ncbi:SLBB domain-containing protein [Pseudoalteromonas sp. MMG012]|uniref:SLBB domain-containing protein n=1 Tax=Pseudoalteromonas sp. MMG012 TaxID=2822686 RepID=UPI003916EC75
MVVIAALLCLFFSVLMESAIAASPSAQQMEQFKKLPKAQQEALAKKYGLDLGSLKTNSTTSNEPELPKETIQPRILDEAYEIEEKFKPQLEKLKPFGYELFAGNPTTFMPTELAAIPDTYLVGVGDVIKINFYGKMNQEHELKIDREGRLLIPELSPIGVVGLQFQELKELVKAKVSKEMIGVQAFISMGTLNPMRIMIVGEAYKPGSYTVSPLATVTHALFVAGGVNETGSLRSIQVKRAGKLVTKFDLYDLLLFGDSSNDVVLKPGDVVFIPPAAKRITVKGEVNRQAIFELKETDSIDSVIAMSGGFKASAQTSKVAVSRYNGDGKRITLNYDFANNTNYKPNNGDEIKVNATSSRLQNTITLVGAVTSPGHYQWQPNKTVRDVFSSPREDLLSLADYSYSLVVREANLEGDIEVIQFSLEDVVIKKNHDVELRSNDIIVVFSRYALIEDEQSLLSDLAYNEEQLKLRENIRLWKKYEKDEFLNYIGLQVEEDLEEKESINSISALFEVNDEIKDNEYAVFSRHNLLSPIIAKLQKQSSATEPAKLFAVNGKVKFPGVYPLPKLANFEKVVNASGGLLESAYLENVELTRIDFEGSDKVQHLQFNAVDELEAPTHEIVSKDTINIFPKPHWQERLEVEVIGEVSFPGTYTIRRGETLESLLERAGGFSKFAHKNGAIFTRESIKIKEASQLQKLTQDLRRNIVTNSFQKNSATSANLSYSDMDKILKDLSKVEALGRLLIDLDNVSTQTLQLEDGDALYVPPMQDSVSVIGEVNVVSTHIYDANKDVKSYLAASGGLKQKADDDRIYIIKANGSVVIPHGHNSWFAVNSKSNLLSPGDTIVVPLDTQHLDSLTLWSTATQIIYQLGLAAASLNSLSSK